MHLQKLTTVIPIGQFSALHLVFPHALQEYSRHMQMVNGKLITFISRFYPKHLTLSHSWSGGSWGSVSCSGTPRSPGWNLLSYCRTARLSTSPNVPGAGVQIYSPAPHTTPVADPIATTSLKRALCWHRNAFPMVQSSIYHITIQ